MTSTVRTPLQRISQGIGVLAVGSVILLAASATTAAGLPAAAQPVAACTAGATSVAFHPGQGAAGSLYGRIVVRNTSERPCTVHGYGGISYVGHHNGTQIGAASVRVPAKVRTLTLRPGAKAHAQVQMTEAGNYSRRSCHPTRVDGFRVYLPGETHSQFARHTTTGCANARITLLHNKPYRR